MTREVCVNTCITAGYGVAGIEYSTQCFCDNFIRNGGAITKDTDCNMNCGGNTAEKCGDGNRLSLFATGDLVIYQPPAQQTTGLPGSWQYMGCLSDNVNGVRAIPYQSVFQTTNTPSLCVKLCSDYGYNAAGVEYGQECYCGDLADVAAATGSIIVADTYCNTPCPGDPTLLCGSGNRLSYFNWVGTPLQTFKFPTGNNAGAYANFVTSPVVPLITTQGRNGKITFVEKSGTSTTPGSTGAYELDPLTKTFRTMNVKTDVFCSAGLTLPDKVGRQINIGGWSGDSTFGIRLYWPDGSPGATSVNDWQENFQELALQKGRWYPSAMIMPNGSILVVGGEDGSNGAAVPSIELLPRVGAPVTMDWLQTTDPYNLYPFLAVMPSGGILVAYYNQARILDPVSFNTIKTLPQIPGAVNNAAGGRTYPLVSEAIILVLIIEPI